MSDRKQVQERHYEVQVQVTMVRTVTVVLAEDSAQARAKAEWYTRQHTLATGEDEFTATLTREVTG